MWNSTPSAKPVVPTSSVSACMIARVRWFFQVVTASVASVRATASKPTMMPMTTVTSCFTTVYGLMLLRHRKPPSQVREEQPLTGLPDAQFAARSLVDQVKHTDTRCTPAA